MALRLQLGAQVMVPAIPADTVFAQKKGWNTLFGGSGESHLKLSIDGHLPLFGPQSPDTMLVRVDETGGVGSRVYV